MEKKVNSSKPTQKANANFSKKNTKSDIKRPITSMQAIYVPKYLSSKPRNSCNHSKTQKKQTRKKMKFQKNLKKK